MFTKEEVLKAYIYCRKNKRNTINALRFEQNFESNLLSIQTELNDKSYKSGKSICFVVTCHKMREVFAADFRDRIVHHLLVSKLEPHFEKRFISTSLTCWKDKGLLKAVEYITKSVKKITTNNTKTAYYGRFDIRSFFTSIDKTILEEIIVKEIQDHFPKSQQEDLVWLTKVIINHNLIKNYYLKGDHKLIDLIPAHKTLFKSENNRGLLIGNLTSQFFANVYLNEFDQFVIRTLKVKHYVRYVDDFVILSTDLDQIREWRKEIDLFLE